MSLCFVSNKDLTVAFSDLARHLKDNGEDVVWLSPSTRWSRWLQSQGWPASDILNLADFANEWQNLDIDSSIAMLVDLETDEPTTVSNIILMCRNLRRRPKTVAYGYLAVARRHIERFLRSHRVEVVFGEGTWGFELMAWLVSQRIGIPMVTPVTTRIPNDRFYFADAKSGDLFQIAESAPVDRAWAEEFLITWTQRPTQPRFAQDIRTFDWWWVREFAIGFFRPKLDLYDETLWPLHLRIRDRLRRLANKKMFSLFRPYDRPRGQERFVLFCLHHQPESSVDVLGCLHSNQAALIETLSRLLPATHKLWVKEHPGALGDRSISWYRKLSRLPNVRLIDPFQEIYGLIRSADIVVTISGTVGYEAALLRVPALGLAPVFFAPLMSNDISARTHPLEWRFLEILAAPRTDATTEEHRKRVDFLARLRANSFAGDPAVLRIARARRASPSHMKEEARAFLDFANALRRRPYTASHTSSLG